MTNKLDIKNWWGMAILCDELVLEKKCLAKTESEARDVVALYKSVKPNNEPRYKFYIYQLSNPNILEEV